MESENWVVENLRNALSGWENKLNEIWQLLTLSPAEFRGVGFGR